MVGHAGIADGAEIDRIEGFELVEPVLRHHPPGARETLAAPVEGLHLEREAMALRRRFKHAQARRYHLVADAIARDGGDLVGLAHGSGLFCCARRRHDSEAKRRGKAVLSTEASAFGATLRPREIAAPALGDANAGLALKNEQIEGRRLAGPLGEETMRLAAMVRLVAEEMQQQRREILLDLGRIARRAIADDPGKVGVVETVDIGENARILGLTRRAPLGGIVIKDGVELVARRARAGEALQPNAVAEEEMVQGPMQGAEEGAAIGTVVALGKRLRGVVEAPIDPLIIGRQHLNCY